MFNIFNKKTEVILDCFTYLPHAYDYAKINYASKHFPDWWKSMPGKGFDSINDEESGTIKHCRGVIDFYKHGVVIPSWFSMQITVFSTNDPEGRSTHIAYSNNKMDFSSSHAAWQFEGFAQEHGKNIKITSPWAFSTKENINWVWSQPTWSMENMNDHVSVLPAVVNYKYQHVTNINLFVKNKEQEHAFFIPPITPLVILHPMTEKKIVIKNHLVDEKEFARKFSIDEFILRRTVEDHAKQFEIKKQLIDKVEKMECPFHKGS